MRSDVVDLAASWYRTGNRMMRTLWAPWRFGADGGGVRRPGESDRVGEEPEPATFQQS